MSSSTGALGQAALHLRNAAPEQWEAFLTEFRRLTYGKVDAVTEADTGMILICQGRAQQAKSLLRTFEECDKPLKSPAP